MKWIFIIFFVLVVNKNDQIYCGPVEDNETTTLKKQETTTNQWKWDDGWEDEEACELHEKCVPYYLCKENHEINVDGALLIDERSDAPKESPVGCPTLEKCCKKSDYIQPPTTPASQNEVFKTSSTVTPSCGLRNPSGFGGIDNNIQNRTLYAKYAEFPWMVAVIVEKTAGAKIVSYFHSGGSLIHPKVIITSAHNIVGINSNKIVIRAGAWNLQNKSETREEQRVQKVITHEDFNRDNLQNDIALVILDNELEMNQAVNTICLPPKNWNSEGKRCFASGWGKNKFGKTGNFQNVLKKIEMPIVLRSECEAKLRKTRLGMDFRLHDGFLCAGGEKDKDLCTGDGGSPLVCEVPSDPQHYYQAGIVVGGIGCGDKDVPGFYLDVAKYRDWIDEKLQGLGLEASSYTY